MDKKYVKLFTEIARVIGILAESVMEYNYRQKDSKGVETSTFMRDDYTQLRDKLMSEDFDPSTLTRAEYAKLLVGSLIITKQIEDKIKKDEIGLRGYKTDLIPKLEQVVNETKTDEEAQNIAKKIFEVNE